MLATAVALALSLATTSPPAVVVLPLAATPGVDAKEVKGIDALVRARLDESDFLRALPVQRDDAREAFRCGRDPGCLGRLAFARGADLLAAGFVEEASEGYTLRLVVVEASAAVVLREVEEPLYGNRDDLTHWIDRALRRAFAPAALAGGVFVVGEPAGAEVLVDGKVAGPLPFTEPLAGLVEGDHVVTVTHAGYARWERRIAVRYLEVVRLEVTLRKERASDADDGAEAEAGLLGGPLIPLAVGSVGVVAFGAGGVLGTLALLDQLEVERRAAVKQLILPRDEELLRRGESFALAANVLYALGALALASGAALFVVDVVTTPEPAAPETFEGAAEGAPAADELRPELVPQ